MKDFYINQITIKHNQFYSIPHIIFLSGFVRSMRIIADPPVIRAGIKKKT